MKSTRLRGPQDTMTTTITDRDTIIINNLPLVRYVVRSMTRYADASPIVDYEDLVGYGTEGLIKAVTTFDPARNTRFSTWAVLHIRATILEALRALDPLPRSLRAKGKAIERTRADLATRNGVWPDAAAVAAALGVSIAELQATLQLLSTSICSLHATNDAGSDDGGDTLLASLVDADPHLDPEHVLEARETRHLVLALLDRLPAREAQVLRLRYWQECDLQTIARLLGVSPSRISQLHTRALALLRAALNPMPAAAAATAA